MNGYSITTAKQHAGYTLIEALVTVALVAILATVAVPSYRWAVLKNRRMEAQSFLMDIAQRQQQYLLDTRTYAADLTELGVEIPSNVSNYYTINCCNTDTAPPEFKAKAIPAGSQSADKCATLVIDQSGKKDTEPTGLSDCW